MQSLGASMASPAEIPSMQELMSFGFIAQDTIQKTDFKEEIAEYLGAMASTDVTNLQEIIEFVSSFC